MLQTGSMVCRGLRRQVLDDVESGEFYRAKMIDLELGPGLGSKAIRLHDLHVLVAVTELARAVEARGNISGFRP